LNPEHDDIEFTVSYKTESLEFGLWITNGKNAFKDSKIDFKECNVKIEIPKKLAMSVSKPHGCRYYWTREDYLTPQNSEFQSIGGVMHIEMIEVPDELTRLPNSPWQISERLTEITKIDYGLSESKEVQKVDVFRTLPPHSFLGPLDFQVRWWNQEKAEWMDDCDGDVAINRETRVLSFTATRLHPLALSYPANSYLQVNSWTIEPTGKERCVMTLDSELLGIKIEIFYKGWEKESNDGFIGGAEVRLLPVGPPIAELSHIYDQPHNASSLIQELRRVGINLWRSSINGRKNKDVEQKAYAEIATIAACFEVSFSRWNQTVAENSCLFQLRKPLTMDEKAKLVEHGKSGWNLMLVDDEKCVFLKSDEHAETLDLETPNDEIMQHESHVSIRRCTDPLSNDAILRDFNMTSLGFQETIRALLCFLKPLQIVKVQQEMS